MIDYTADRNLRVVADLGDGPGFWIFRALTPSGYVVLAGEGGLEQWVPRLEVKSIELAPVTCPKCGAQHQVDRPGQRCVACESIFARSQPSPREECEDCSAPGAYYSPKAKRFRCANCHAKAGTNSGLHVESRVREDLAGDACKGQGVDDPRHSWVHMRGARYHCRHCKTATFEKPKTYDLEV